MARTDPRTHRRSRRRAVFAAAWSVVAVACSSGGHHLTARTTLPPTTTTVAPTTTTAPVIRYQVKAGDTLSAIAARNHVTSTAIIALNRLANPDQLVAGQVLSIPNPPSSKPAAPGQPATLSITPLAGPPGQVFGLTLSGARAGETVTFQITGPAGASFTGPPHTAPAGGQIAAGYATSGGDPSGQYQVLAKGNQGTSAHATFEVSQTATTTSSA
jgi:LysM repeat protein